jgi:hypothetical protein
MWHRVLSVAVLCLLADAATVARHCTDGRPTVWMGTRLGALVAAGSTSGDLIMWDPVLDANAYFRDILRAAVFSAFKTDDPGTAPKSDLIKHLQESGQVDLLGYPLSLRLYDEVRASQPLSELDVDGRTITMIDIRRRGTPRNDTNRLAERWRGAGASVEATAVALNEPWWYGARPGSAADELDQASEDLLQLTIDAVGSTVNA